MAAAEMHQLRPVAGVGAPTRVTLRDVAARAGVHFSTVSRALDPERATEVSVNTRERVRAIADELGYRGDSVASGLRRGRTFAIGVVVPDLSNPSFSPVIRGIENSLEGRGLMTLVAETQDSDARLRRVLESFRSRRIDAVIVAAGRHGDEPVLRKLAAEVPVVLAVRSLPGSGLPAVTHDDERGGRLAAEHLLQQGHRRIGHIVGPAGISSFHDRAAGFRAALRDGGAEVVEVAETAVRPVLDEGRRLMDLFLTQHDDVPTAFFIHNDLMVFGALQALSKHGLSCPDDVALVGYNDTPMTEFTNPTITTVRLPTYALGRMAADTAVSLIEDDARSIPTLPLAPTLVPRASTLGWQRTA